MSKRQAEKDRETLRFIFDRMVEYHGENPDFDYMIFFDEAIKRLAPDAEPEPDEIIRLEHLKRVRLEPDDFLVLETPLRLTEDYVSHLTDLLKQIFGEDRRVIIMEEGMTLGVVAPEAKLAEERGDLDPVRIPYHTDGPGNLICPHCQTLTNKHYAGVPNLPCWKCGKPMDPKTVVEKIDWRWLSPENILHAYHPTRNSVTACEADWDGWSFLREPIDLEQYKLCEECRRVVNASAAAVPEKTGG